MPEAKTAPRLIVFDLDGTLVDSQADLATAVNAALASCSRPSLPEPQIASFIGDGAAALVQRSLAATGAVDDQLAEYALAAFFAYYREHLLDHTFAYPGVIEALQTIRNLAPDLPMAVLTNKPVGPSRRICEGLGLSPYFFANYGGDSFPVKKPDPLGLLQIVAEAAQRWPGVTVDRTVMVGDSDIDLKTARAAGAISLGCLYGYAKEAMLASGPDIVVSSASEWPKSFGLLD